MKQKKYIPKEIEAKWPFGKLRVNRKYIPSQIEKKWQDIWRKQGLYKFKLDGSKKKYYNLVELPYPSGDLHLGHWFAFSPADAHARYKKMSGYNVFFPNGFDAFGLPAENAAIKRGIHPQDWTMSNIKAMRVQFDTMGTMIDWSHEAITCMPQYYKWNQWIFLKMYEKGLAYRGKAMSNWCPSCQTVLANENIENGKCWRCGTEVIQKEIEQWFLKITDYADKLLWDNTDKEVSNGVNWPQSVREGQNNWIGRSEGVEIEFPLKNDYNYVLLHGFGGTPDKDFFPWLKEELKKEGLKVYVPQLPNTDNATEEEQVSYVLKNVPLDNRTILFGHSLGAVVAMKVAEKLDKKIAGLVLAGGFIKPQFKDHDLRPFKDTFKWEFNFAKIKSNVGFIKILSDVTDQIVPVERGRELHEALDGELLEIKAEYPHFNSSEEPVILKALVPSLPVFTTRPDTLYGATFMVVSPEHPMMQGLIDPKNKKLASSNPHVEGVKQYAELASKKTELERKESREKTGVFTGIYAINPVTNESIPVWVAEYVLMGYGTGAIMAVPAHDERDFEFAKKYNLGIKRVIAPETLTDRSYLMGADQISDEELKKINISIVEKTSNGSRKLEIPSKAIDQYKTLIREKLSNGYWNEIVGSEVWFLFKDKNGQINEYLLSNQNKEEIAKKCSHFNNDPIEKTNNLWLYLAENDWYKPSIIHDQEGMIINSADWDSLKVPHEIGKVIEDLKQKAIATLTTQYHLHDWSISRQRYWGTPVPMIHCPKCGIVPVPYEDLPVELPYEVDYTPKGKPPLATAREWIKVKCPKCGGEAERDAETLDTFFDSAWYYLRYLDPKFEKGPFDSDLAQKIMPVDIYFGGSEHTLGHTLYARFFTKFFKDLGLVDFDEFANKRVQHGVILGPDGYRMSKSRGNVVNPDDVVKEYGSDTVRLYLCFMMPHEATAPWDPGAISGIYRFLRRVWDLYEKVQDAGPATHFPSSRVTRNRLSNEDLYQMHKTIKKVGEDLENIKFNTAVAALMEWLNHLSRKEKVSFEEYKTLLSLLAPFAPHMTEELYQFLGNPKLKSIHLESWPEFDEKYLVEDLITIVVQVNGKVRDTIEVQNSKIKDQNEIEKIAREKDNVKKYLDEKEVKKVIYIKGKLINFVI